MGGLEGRRKGAGLAGRALAGVMALALAAGPAAPAFADGGSPTGGSGSTSGEHTGGVNHAVTWQYRDAGTAARNAADPCAGSWGCAIVGGRPNTQAVIDAVNDAGVTAGLDGTGRGGTDAPGQPKANIDAAITKANRECEERGGKNCRIVGVGFAYATASRGTTGYHYWGTEIAPGNEYDQKWKALTAGKMHMHNGQRYKTSDPFAGSSLTVDALEAKETTTDDRNVIVIVLGQGEPANPAYNLSGSTSKTLPAGIRAGTAGAVSDNLSLTCASASCAADQTVAATVTLRWKGFDGRTGGKAKSFSAAVPATGSKTTGSPSFTPADLGMETWSPGDYWFDVSIPRQSNLGSALDLRGETTASESWRLRVPLAIGTDATADTAPADGGGDDADDTVTDRVTVSCGNAACPALTLPKVTVTLTTPDGTLGSVIQDVELGTTKDFTFTRPARQAAWVAGGYWFTATVGGLDTGVYEQASYTHNADGTVASEHFDKTWTPNLDTQASVAGYTTTDQAADNPMTDTITATACESTGQGSYCDPVTITGTATLAYTPLTGSTTAAAGTASKTATVDLAHRDGDKDNPLDGTGTATFTPADLGMTTWQPGLYSYAFDATRAANPVLTADVHHDATDDTDEEFIVVPTPSKAWTHVGGRTDPYTGQGGQGTDDITDQDIVDQDRGNDTAGDRDAYASGTRVASAATSVVPLAWIAGGFTLTDDWGAAAAIFTPDATPDDPGRNVAVYEVTGTESQNPVRDGKDVTGEFDFTVTGSTLTASTNDTWQRPDAEWAQYTLVIKGTAAYDTDALGDGQEMTFCSVDGTTGKATQGDGHDDQGHGFTNAAAVSFAIADKFGGAQAELQTNQPWICGYIPPTVTKDVRYDVTGASIDGSQNVEQGSQVVYTLASGTLDRTGRQAAGETWKSLAFTDQVGKLDEPTGKWAVYATRGDQDLTPDRIVAQGGTGSDDDTLFTWQWDPGTRTITVTGTQALLDQLNQGTDTLGGATRFTVAWQADRTGIGDQEDQHHFHPNGGDWESNTVVTGTPAHTEGIAIEKFDTGSGETQGDRDDKKQSLSIDQGGTVRIGVKITNTGTLPLTDLDLTDATVDGTTGTVSDWEYPDGWKGLVLQSGETTYVYGTLHDVKAGTDHHDVSTVTANPVPVCRQTDGNPFDTTPSAPSCQCMDDGAVTVVTQGGTPAEMSQGVPAGPVPGCSALPVKLTASDGWWGATPMAPLGNLAKTGASVAAAGIATAGLAATGAAPAIARRRTHATAHGDGGMTAGK